MIDLLLDAGADPDQRNDWWAGGFGPLNDCREETAKYLIQRGATLTPHAAARLSWITELRQILDRNPKAVRQRGGDGQFPLHFSRSPQIAELLLSRGAEIDALDLDHESTAAQWCLPERTEVAAYLVSRGTRLDPFMAAMIGDRAAVQRFVESDPDSIHSRITRDRFPTSPKAAGHIYLFTIGENCTLMHAAANGNRPEIVRWLASVGTDVNARGGYDDQTPLHAAAWRDCPEAAAALLDAGADINIRSGKLHDNEPIGWAIVSGAARAVQLLLSRGCVPRDVHRADAVQGAAGMWRCFNRRRPLEAWHEVARLIGGSCEPRR
jgi:ankyrin repeat protein